MFEQYNVDWRSVSIVLAGGGITFALWQLASVKAAEIELQSTMAQYQLSQMDMPDQESDEPRRSGTWN